MSNNFIKLTRKILRLFLLINRKKLQKALINRKKLHF